MKHGRRSRWPCTRRSRPLSPAGPRPARRRRSPRRSPPSYAAISVTRDRSHSASAHARPRSAAPAGKAAARLLQPPKSTLVLWHRSARQHTVEDYPVVTAAMADQDMTSPQWLQLLQQQQRHAMMLLSQWGDLLHCSKYAPIGLRRETAMFLASIQPPNSYAMQLSRLVALHFSGVYLNVGARDQIAHVLECVARGAVLFHVMKSANWTCSEVPQGDVDYPQTPLPMQDTVASGNASLFSPFRPLSFAQDHVAPERAEALMPAITASPPSDHDRPDHALQSAASQASASASDSPNVVQRCLFPADSADAPRDVDRTSDSAAAATLQPAPVLEDAKSPSDARHVSEASAPAPSKPRASEAVQAAWSVIRKCVAWGASTIWTLTSVLLPGPLPLTTIDTAMKALQSGAQPPQWMQKLRQALVAMQADMPVTVQGDDRTAADTTLLPPSVLSGSSHADPHAA